MINAVWSLGVVRGAQWSGSVVKTGRKICVQILMQTILEISHLEDVEAEGS